MDRQAIIAVAEPLAIVLNTRSLARLALISFMYSAVQVSLTSFVIVFLTEALGWSLVAAGLVLTAATLAGVVGRIGWGALADRTRAPGSVLALVGALAAACAVAFALASAGASGWNACSRAPAIGMLVAASR